MDLASPEMVTVGQGTEVGTETMGTGAANEARIQAMTMACTGMRARMSRWTRIVRIQPQTMMRTDNGPVRRAGESERCITNWHGRRLGSLPARIFIHPLLVRGFR